MGQVAADTWNYPGSTLVSITDGDSFYATVTRTVLYASVNFDIGFHAQLAPTIEVPVTWRQKFRLDGCNAAPSSTPSGAGAKVRLGELLSMGPFNLTSVGPYKYGDEWMAQVVLADGRSVTSVMVAEQWAAAWNGQGAQPLPPWPRTV